MEEVRMISDPLEARLLAPEPGHVVRVGLAVPVSGTLGMMGPAVLNCAGLAVAELNAAGGLLGLPVELVLVDAGREPRTVAAELADLARSGAIAGVVGAHASDVRVEVVRVLAGQIPYVYTPPYEGGESAPGVYLLGETPGRQLRPALDWLVTNRRARRWALIGNDYVWPRRLNRAATAYLRAVHATVVASRYVPLGDLDPEPLLDLVAASRADAVLLTLVGSDLVRFNRAFAATRLDHRVLRLCAALEENGLLGAGGDTSGELYATMGYFGSVATDTGLDFVERYTHRYGWQAPVLNGHAEACYDGVRLLAALAGRAGSLDPARIDATSDGTTITGGRGRLTVAARHVDQPVYLARADGLDFDVLRAF
ncbi:substrate-binding domain-containing protein [Dactylosporangium fulvum]|uniref:Substrate-binding domain-containing protein n=1 Tax=Dactylosporangium fulvum TaxID=53359 RepID=A0ABY5W167_9ACTN|nr:substrate-binding domain-containing protein [Dactylosporangium fulvum]UWP83277.1 substrate-binding domain-containing protein [Dactylosporangium fulvum]